MGEEEEETAHVIPTELEEEILHRLPLNDLLRFKAVCRNWRRLISSHRFIQKHLERSTSGCNGARLFTINKRCSEIIDLENNSITKKIPLHNVKTILGSCDGLVLCGLGGRRIAAVNPSTGRYVVRTPNLSICNDIESRICSWFGRHPGTGEYVFVLVSALFSTALSSTWRFVFDVYSLACNNQNPILSSSSYPLSCSLTNFTYIGTFLHRRLHFLFGLGGIFGPGLEIVVLVHNFEVNSKIEKMWCPVKVTPTLGVVDGCLSVIGIVSEVYEVWVMKEYGNVESWTRLANIEGLRITCDNILSIVLPSDSCRNGNYVEQPVIKYCFGNKEAEIETASTYSYGFKCIACIDSLVSPDSLVFGEMEKEEATGD